MRRARGDGKYAGWPWYPKIVKAAEDVGIKTLPCLMGAVEVKRDATGDNDPSFTPNKEWRRQMALAVSTFDTLTAFELDNEADGLMFKTLDGYASNIYILNVCTSLCTSNQRTSVVILLQLNTFEVDIVDSNQTSSSSNQTVH